jgi:ABC-type uncharacterized transport system auxiliary subunit
MKCALPIVAAMMLAGCVTSRQAPKQYDFGDFIAPRQRSNALSARLVVRDVTQPSWLWTKDIFFRLDYASPARPQRYAMSQWVATPGELITRRLQDTVASANAGFTLQASNRSEGYLLQASLEVFTQAFTAPAESRCIVQLSASLWRSTDQIVAQRVFRSELPAQTPDARGAAVCLASGVNLESDEIVEWLSAEIAGTPSGDPARR